MEERTEASPALAMARVFVRERADVCAIATRCDTYLGGVMLY